VSFVSLVVNQLPEHYGVSACRGFVVNCRRMLTTFALTLSCKGEQLMAGRAAVVSIDMSPGKVVLFGLRPQHRAQTHATFPMLFNALYLSALGDAPAKTSSSNEPRTVNREP
jgi:hypothetical protein